MNSEQPAGWQREPADPDVADSPASTQHRTATVLAVIAVGGAVGAAARYGAGLAWPTAEAAFPWTTLLINVVGCACMGVLMVLVSERDGAPPLLRPFLGTGVLGGFTTFSTYAVDVDRLRRLDAVASAGATLVLTLVLAVLAVWAGATLTRTLLGRSA